MSREPKVVKVSEKEFMMHYRKYSKLVYSVIGGFKNLSRNEADDIAAEIFAMIPDLLLKYDSSRAKFSTFLVIVIKNYIFTYLKSKASKEEIYFIDPDDIVDEKTLSSPTNFKIESLEKVLEPIEYEMVFMLYCMNITLMTYCKMVGCTRAVARYRHKKVLEKVKEIIKDY